MSKRSVEGRKFILCKPTYVKVINKMETMIND